VIIETTAFEDYEIEEEKDELKIKLKKGRRFM
jgi:hypothetical protein